MHFLVGEMRVILPSFQGSCEDEEGNMYNVLNTVSGAKQVLNIHDWFCNVSDHCKVLSHTFN